MKKHRDSFKEFSSESNIQCKTICNKDEINKGAILYRHVKELSLFKYQNEERREDSIIQQSANMQTAFSVITAVLFMVIPILIENCNRLSLKFLLIATSVISFFLFISLLFASLAQFRWKYKASPSVKELENIIDNNWENSLAEEQQLKQFVNLLGEVDNSKQEINNKRVRFLRISMFSFFISLFSIFLFYIIGIYIIL